MIIQSQMSLKCSSSKKHEELFIPTRCLSKILLLLLPEHHMKNDIFKDTHTQGCGFFFLIVTILLMENMIYRYVNSPACVYIDREELNIKRLYNLLIMICRKIRHCLQPFIVETKISANIIYSLIEKIYKF